MPSVLRPKAVLKTSGTVSPNTDLKLYVPSVGFSVPGLDRAQCGFLSISKFFVYC